LLKRNLVSEEHFFFEFVIDPDLKQKTINILKGK